MSMPTVGMAGLGRMGAPMAGRLVAAGYEVAGFDPAGTAERLPNGATAVELIEELAGTADVMLLSVPDGAVSKSISVHIANAQPRRVVTVIDLSTIGVAAARACAEKLATVGVDYVDAPVSGGIAGARAGTLAIMIGADPDTYARVEPILSVLGSRRFRVGDEPGHGQTMKLLNNFVAATSLAATSEATVFGARMGLDLTTMVDVLNAATGRTAVSEDKFPRSIIPGTYDFGFAAALMTKDVELYLDNATQARVPHNIADATASSWRSFLDAHPDADFTYIHRFLETQAGDE